MMLTHICPLCGKEHEREETPEPMSKACLECWVNNPLSFVVMKKDDWDTILDILVRSDEKAFLSKDADRQNIPNLFRDIARQVYPNADETIRHIMSEKSKQTGAKEKAPAIKRKFHHS